MSETPEIVFADPPPTKKGPGSRGQSPLGLWLAALRDHPGRWAEFPQPMSSTVATQIKQGKRCGVRPGEFEVTRRSTGDGKTYRLFARYVGGES